MTGESPIELPEEASGNDRPTTRPAGGDEDPGVGLPMWQPTTDPRIREPHSLANSRYAHQIPIVLATSLSSWSPQRRWVYDALIDLIIGGKLSPGQRIVVTSLVTQIGVSRQPIRAVLDRLEAEGWVDLRPGRGAFVHVPTIGEVDELFDVLAMISAETASRAARAAHASPDQVARLWAIHREGQAATAVGDFGTAAVMNSVFSATVAAVAANTVLAELTGLIGQRVQWYYRIAAPARGHDPWSEHEEMIQAIEAGDADYAQLLARKHIELAREAYRHADKHNDDHRGACGIPADRGDGGITAADRDGGAIMPADRGDGGITADRHDGSIIIPGVNTAITADRGDGGITADRDGDAIIADCGDGDEAPPHFG